MEWITHREWDGKTLSGPHRLKRGDLLTEVNGILFKGRAPICMANSQATKEHFAPNQDGCGLKRGAITYAIAFDKKLSELQKGALLASPFCQKFLVPDRRVILFTDRFFCASMLELYQVCNLLGVPVEEVIRSESRK